MTVFLFVQANTPSDEEREQSYYQDIDQQIKENELIGKTKEEVIEIFGETDSTTTTLIYDFTFRESSAKYILEIEFDNNRVVRYYKKKE
jgi:hypothetical protein